jgi:hypothetical protein
MKKITALTVFLLVVAVNTFGQEMLNLNKYSAYFLNANGRLDRPYLRAATDEDYNRIAALGGDELSLDTPLEIALLSICSGVADIRPAEANRMLGTPKQADQKLGAAVFQEIQILRFLGDTASVCRHEAVLKFITDRGNVTRAEVEAYYRNGIAGLVSQIVDEQLARWRSGNPNFHVSADSLASIKDAITTFMLEPSEATYRNLLYQHRGGMGNTPIILGSSVEQFNEAVADALSRNRILGVQ